MSDVLFSRLLGIFLADRLRPGRPKLRQLHSNIWTIKATAQVDQYIHLLRNKHMGLRGHGLHEPVGSCISKPNNPQLEKGDLAREVSHK